VENTAFGTIPATATVNLLFSRPIRSDIVITLDVLVIYALAVHGRTARV
jgi:hypothetical protein